MKRKYYTYMAALCSLLIFASCDKEAVDIPGTETGKVPITLSASSLPVSVDVQTRAETIDGRTIGVVAANTDETTPLTSVDWSNYYLDHVKASGTNTVLNGEKEVAFSPAQYWPFNPAEYLAFVAYSPYYGTNGDSRVELVSGNNTLKVTANGNSFPDFLYTEPVGPYNKESAKEATDKAISLGKFQHAMAKLDIQVKLVDKDGVEIPPANFPNPNRLRIAELKVLTEVKNGEFYLLQTTSPKAWTNLDATGTKEIVRTHISSLITLTATLPTYTNCFLLPGTEEKSYVFIKIQELHPTTNTVVNEVLREAKITEFEVSSGEGAKLEMGKTTLLTIKVKYVPIPDPDIDVILEGQLVEWDYKGESTVTIE